MGGKSGTPPGYRSWKIGVLLDEEQKKKFIVFLREYRSRVLALAFGGDRGLQKPYQKFRYVPILAREARHVFNRSDSIRKASRIWPMLTVKLVQQGKTIYGDTGAPVVLDVSRSEVRIPFLKIKRQTKIIERIAGDLALNPRPKFVAQLVLKRDGMGRDILVVNVIAFRETKPSHSHKALVLAYDINSRYGVTLVTLALDENEAKLILLKRYKPPNHTARRKQAAGLQNKGRIDEAAKVRRKEKKLNQEFVKNIVADARKTIRQWTAKGYATYILVDKPEAKSLKGTSLTGTLNSLTDRLKNLATYEGAHYIELRASGKYCPVCGTHYTKEERKNDKRIYRCPWGHAFDRDYAASWNLILAYFKSHREVIRKLLQRLGPRAMGAPPISNSPHAPSQN